MRKPRLGSSIRALQEAIINLKSLSSPCTQQPKTHSFRREEEEVLLERIDFSSSSSFHSMVSNRFFFSPSTTKSIMEEAKVRVMMSNLEVEMETGEEDRDHATMVGSVLVVMASSDPFMDFRVSMEEMVEAHEHLREWAGLHELLLCYLKVNEKRDHKVIVMAFLDLLRKFIAQ